jgi:hypothetical protein
VQTTYGDGVVSDLAVAPRSRTGDIRPSPPVQAVVYEQDCSHKIATVKLAASQYIWIDQSGNVSTPATMSNFERNAVPEQQPPRPSSCP